MRSKGILCFWVYAPSEIRCIGCGTRRSCTEAFTDLSVTATPHDTHTSQPPDRLNECLERLVKQETLDGYACSKCGVRDKSRKKSIVKTLPNV